MNKDGTGYEVVHGFTKAGARGAAPVGGVFENPGGTLTGVTGEGGAMGYGTIFQTGNLPAITSHPQDYIGWGPPMLTVSGASATPLTYQWFKDGVPIAGATNSLHVVTPFGAAAAGLYHAAVGNFFGEAFSLPATVSYFALTGFSAGPQLTIAGPPGTEYNVIYRDALQSTNSWQLLTNLFLLQSLEQVSDPDLTTQRFYRAVLLLP